METSQKPTDDATAVLPSQPAPASQTQTESTAPVSPDTKEPSLSSPSGPSSDETKDVPGNPPAGPLSTTTTQPYVPPVPPKRVSVYNGNTEDPESLHYTRDPHVLTAYLVSFPRPILKQQTLEVPRRFLIYTPPPPPIPAPKEGEKETRIQKIQRKWQDEVRQAKTTDAKVTSWKGAKGRVTKGIDWAMGQTKNSSLEFLTRIPGASGKVSSPAAAKSDKQKEKEKEKDASSSDSDAKEDTHANDGHPEQAETKATVGLEEMVLFYPASVPGTQAEIRTEFINSMLRTKSKAQRDAIIATGLIPVSAAIDLLATLVWPFGGLLEIDAVWAAASFRGAKTARSVTKRLNSTATEETSGTGSGVPAEAMTGSDTKQNTVAGGQAPQKPTEHSGAEKRKSGIFDKIMTALPANLPLPKAVSGASAAEKEPTLKLTFIPSPRIETLNAFLASECHTRDSKLFGSPGVVPTESDVITAIGWHPNQTEGETKNWEDEQWELQQVKEDVKLVMKKGAREWGRWCKAFEKNPDKALTK